MRDSVMLSPRRGLLKRIKGSAGYPRAKNRSPAALVRMKTGAAPLDVDYVSSFAFALFAVWRTHNFTGG
jgi:hypothetical protein